MDAPETASGEGDRAQAAPVPETCFYCGATLKAKAFANGATELKCTKTVADKYGPAHAMTFYLKKS